MIWSDWVLKARHFAITAFAVFFCFSSALVQAGPLNKNYLTFDQRSAGETTPFLVEQGDRLPTLSGRWKTRTAGFLAIAGVLSLGATAIYGIVPSSFALPKNNDSEALSRKFDEAHRLPIILSMGLNFEEELDQKLQELYQVGSPNYHHFLTPVEFHERYSPSEDQMVRVQDYLQSNGIQVSSITESRLLVHAEAPVCVLNEIFGAEIHSFEDEAGHIHWVPSSELRLPPEFDRLNIRSIHGLYGDFQIASRSPARAKGAFHHVGRYPFSGPGGGMAPADIQRFYNITSEYNGRGQTLALFELDGFNISDIEGYGKEFNLSVPIRSVLVGSASGAAGMNALEVTLDIQMMMALAPEAKEIVVYQGNLFDALSILDRMTSDQNLPQTISSSFVIRGSKIHWLARSEEVFFKKMAIQGQTMFVASGDNGPINSPYVYDMNTQPYAVIVGGTSIIPGSTGAYTETAWSCPEDYGWDSWCGGGGISEIFEIPDYQKGVITSENLGSKKMRNVPDVSLNSDAVLSPYAVFFNGKWRRVGGTSAAAPLWAAFTALGNQARAEKNKGPVGFLNPILYQLGQSPNSKLVFNDITIGNISEFSAIEGFDLATGWGSFKGSGLLEALASSP